MDDKSFNNSGDLDQPVDNNTAQPTNHSEQTLTNQPAEIASEAVEVKETIESLPQTTDSISVSETTETVSEVSSSDTNTTPEVQETTTVTATETAPQSTDATSISETATSVVAEVVPTLSSSTPSPTEELSQPKKKRTGLIVGIIIALLILGGGGTIAALAIIKNQPENILIDSFNNLLNAKQVAVTGSFNLNPGNEMKQHIGPINIKINSETSNSNSSTSSSISVDYPSLGQPINLDFGEVAMSEGVYYIKASGLKKIYDGVLHDIVEEQLISQIEDQYSYSLIRQCREIEDRETYNNCINQAYTVTDPIILANIQSQVATIQNHIENIISDVDDKWFEFSTEDILDSNLIKQYIDQKTRDSIIKARDCYNNTFNRLSDYSSELSNLYSNNQFITMQADQDSFYKVSFNADKLTNYISAIPKTKLVNDFASCNDITLTEDMFTPPSTNQISNIIDILPNIYMKFDGFLSHHITSLKVEKDYDYFSISADLSFTYPDNLVITAPADSTPIMDKVEDIMEEIEDIANEINY